MECLAATADKYASWLAKLAIKAVLNIFIDYETFENTIEGDRIFEFLEHLPMRFSRRHHVYNTIRSG